jgi:GTP-binding protein HflX
VLVEDRLFATLDPTTRRLSLPGGEPVLLTDTVGFVRRLPHGLVEAFKSTLEVASRPTSSCTSSMRRAGPRGSDRRRARGARRDRRATVPELLVFNKADVAPDVAKEARRHQGSVAVSAVRR